jgi:predicted nucleic acid-binding Zn ribbon protein
MAKATKVELLDGVLQVTARDARWAREVTRATDTILTRLRMFLGSNAIDEVRVHASKEGL